MTGLVELLPARSEPLLSVLHRLVKPGLVGGNSALGVDPLPLPKRPFVKACGVFAPCPPLDGAGASVLAAVTRVAGGGDDGGNRGRLDRSIVPGEILVLLAARDREGVAEPEEEGVRGCFPPEKNEEAEVRGPTAWKVDSEDDGIPESADPRRGCCCCS